MQGTLGETSYPSMRSHRTGSFTDMIPSKPHASKTPQNLKPIHEASFKNHFSETLPSPVTAHTFRIAPQRDMLASPQTMSFASTEFGLFESPKLQAERGVSLHPSHSRTNSTISVPTAEDEDWGTDQSTHPSITDQIGSMSPTASFATLTDPPEVSFTNPFSFDFHPAPTSSPDFSDRPQYSIQSPVSKPLVITLPHTIPPAASHHISLSDPLPVRSPPAITFKPQQSNSVQSWAPISLNTSQTLPGGPVLSPGIQPQPQPRQKKKIVNQTLTWLFSSLSHATLSTMDKNSPALTEMSTQLLTELTQMAQNEPLAQIKSILNSASEAIAVQNAITYGRPESLVAFTKSLQPSLSELLGEIGSSNIIHCLLLREGKERETNPLTQSVLTSCSSIISDGVKTFLPELLCGRVSSRVMQTLINQSPSDISYSIILSIQHNFFSVICDTNGSHCIQLAVKRLNEQQLDGLLDILLSTKNRQVTPIQQAQSLGSLCCHMYACRVVQALLECCSDPQRSRFFTPIAPVAVNLASDAYGNYVMQKILESEDPTIVETISLNLIPHLYSLSLDKIGSNVAEKVMLHCSQNLFFSAILHLFGLSLFLGKIDEDDADALMTLLPHMDKRRLRSILGDQYGNYVVQRVLERATGPVLDFVMASVRLVWTELSSMQHGKHILTTVERIQRRSKKVPAKTNNQPSKTRPNHISIQNTPAKPQAQYSLPQISEPATQTFVPFVQPSSTQQRTIPARSQPSPTLLPLHITLKPQTMNPNSFILGSNGQVTQQVYYP
ncbi:putative Pumilio like protein [Blattamonas nauphoetae]|uniref:Pumilio like protein n=1 Tax=Blattamonas nauphoetae TaxID=2049346 RepID=A0ABQ9Y7T3_9EUKA|nr:putative Pumilio like protein [Blattamonas nauphoetae]